MWISTKLMEIMIFGLLLYTYQKFEQTTCSNAISSEVHGPIGLNFYLRHPGVGLYERYGNYDFGSVIIDVLDIQTD